MSPASSGALEVERYIGACLITSQNRSKGNFKVNGRESSTTAREDFVPRYLNNHHPQRCRSIDGWAGGIPLISFANYQRRGNKVPHYTRFQDHYPLSHLAVHTQGAPLILTHKYHYRKNKSGGLDKNSSKNRHAGVNCKPNDSAQGGDAVSVNSDESSASTNSENCLPRIIKPRKRRKKDRKPTHLLRPLGSEDSFSTDSASPDIETYENSNVNIGVPFTFELNLPNINTFHNEGVTIKLQHDYQESPQLHHAFEDVEDTSKDINDNQQTSSCQCRYCDPSGQIWDVEQHCYSPFLTTPKRQSAFNFSDIQESNYRHAYDFPSLKDLSECVQNIYLDEKSRIKSNSSVLGSRDLEVSTEIVTSLNGHRDLEIKFFSTPTVGSSTKNNVRTLDLSECRRKSDNFKTVVNNQLITEHSSQ